MRRLPLIPLVLAALLLGAPVARADALADTEPLAVPVVRYLAQEGYSDIHVDRTWLGRIRITAMIDARRREIILHPTSGDILRDFIDPRVNAVSDTAVADPAGSDGGSIRIARPLPEGTEVRSDIAEALADAVAEGVTDRVAVEAPAVDGDDPPQPANPAAAAANLPEAAEPIPDDLSVVAPADAAGE